MSGEAAVPQQEIAVIEPAPPPSAAVESQSIYRRILKATALYSIATIAPMAVSMLMLPLFTRFLTPADYGVIELLDATRIVFAMLIGARFTEALLYFYGRATTDEGRRQSVQTVLYGSVLLAILSAAAGWALSPSISKAVFHGSVSVFDLRIAFASFAVGLPVEAAFARLKAIDDQIGYVRTVLLRLALTTISSIVLVVVLRAGVTGVLASALIANAVMFLSFLRSFRQISIRGFQYRLFASQVRIGFLMTATGLAAFIINSGDRFFLQRSVSLAEIGLYGIAYKCGMVVSVAQSAFSQYWSSQVYNLTASTDGLMRFRRVHTYVVLSLCYVAVIISSSANMVFHLFLPSSYFGAVSYIAPIALIYVIRADADYYRSALYVEGLPGADTMISSASGLLCLICYALLIPRFGAWGAIAATAVAFASLGILARLVAIRKRPYAVEPRRSGIAFGIAMIVSAVVTKYVSISAMSTVVALGSAFILYPVLILASGCISGEDARAIRAIAIRRLRRSGAVIGCGQ